MATINPTTPQLKLVRQWVDALVDLDIERTAAVLSKDYKHQRLPKSAGHGEETKEEYITRLKGSLAAFTKFVPTFHDVTEVPGKVIIHATDECTAHFGLSLTHEAIYILSIVEEAGELKISQCKDFIDTQEMNDFSAKYAKAAAEAQGAPAS